MEVHPPDHAIHTWRDFFIHIATIVVGLLIAIGLEQSVEWLHHRELLHQAREQLHQELEINRRLVAVDQHDLAVAAEDSRHNINLLDATAHVKEEQLRIGWRWESMQDSAWQTARGTGALGLMPYAELQHFSTNYAQQALVEAEATHHIRSYTTSLAPLLRHGDLRQVTLASLSPAEREQIAQSSAQNLTEISILQDFLRGLDANYAELSERR